MGLTDLDIVQQFIQSILNVHGKQIQMLNPHYLSFSCNILFLSYTFSLISNCNPENITPTHTNSHFPYIEIFSINLEHRAFTFKIAVLIFKIPLCMNIERYVAFRSRHEGGYVLSIYLFYICNLYAASTSLPMVDILIRKKIANRGDVLCGTMTLNVLSFILFGQTVDFVLFIC